MTFEVIQIDLERQNQLSKEVKQTHAVEDAYVLASKCVCRVSCDCNRFTVFARYEFID